MARGWESKSVEDQQEAAARRRAVDETPSIPPSEVERKQQIDTLMLARARVLSDLQRACRPAHRGMLEQALTEVDARIDAVRNR